MLDDDTGFGDIREDAEDFPELWKHIDDEIAREEAAAAKALQPEIKSENSIFGLAGRAQARKAKLTGANTNVNAVQEASVVIDLTGDENGSETGSLCKSSLDLTFPSHPNMFQARSVVPAAPLSPSQPPKRQTTVSQSDTLADAVLTPNR